jgi:F-type H+-transporting ATPase subunit gamma
VNIRHFERAALSMTEYAEVVEQGWSVLFRSGELALPGGRESRALILVVGSDQGMCGQFNELAIRAGLREGDRLAGQGVDVAYWAAGERIGGGLEDEGRNVVDRVSIPGTLGGVTFAVEGLAARLAEWYQSGQGQFHVVHNAQTELEGYAPLVHRVLPLDTFWKENLLSDPWPSRCLPQTYLPTEVLFTGLFEQHLFVSLYGALARSMAAENAARLGAMQAAEKNIDEMRFHLQRKYRQIRQDIITGELLDIVSGVEAISEPRGR